MIARDALYTFIESLITAAAPSSALFDAASFRNLRGAVDTAQKVVRVECLEGELVLTDEAARKEMNVRSTIQTYCLPTDLEETSLDDAADTSFEMAREIYEAVAGDPSLNAGVCDAQFREFETGHANLGATRYGVTWLDGIINKG